MAGQTPRGYPIFDPSGTDKDKRGDEYLNALTGASPDSLVNVLDREQTTQDSKVAVIEAATSAHGATLDAHNIMLNQLEEDVIRHDVALNAKADSDTVAAALATKADASALTAHVADAEKHVTGTERTAWNAYDNRITNAQTAATNAATAAATADGKAVAAQETADEAMSEATAAKQLGDSVRAATIAVVGGLPEDATFADIHTEIGGAKTTLAANLTEKGVETEPTEPLMALAEKVAEIPAGGGYSKIEEVAILASGNYTIPEGVVMIDVALVGGGYGVNTSAGYGAASGGQVRRYLGITVEAGEVVASQIGAGSGGGNPPPTPGNTSFGEYSSAGGVSGAQGIWGDATSMLVSGRGVINTGGLIPPAGDRTNILAGSAVSTAQGSYHSYIAAAPNTGGGGAYAGSPATIGGASGRIQLRLYYK